MDVDTLLTRQMELHTSVRHPPKNPQGLVQLMEVMRNYKNYFESLRKTAEQFGVEPETVFQAFMYISVGGTVNFDRQHQDGSVPMHQAKVLARSNAIELSSTLRKELPNAELMVYVGLSRDLRTTLRVKVEDGNDLKTAEASVREAVEYLNYIDRCAHHNPERLFRFYMAEDPTSLTALLNESDPLSMTQTMSGTMGGTARGSGVGLPAVFDENGAEAREPTPLPSPLSSFLAELRRQCAQASDASSASGAATRRLRASQVVLDWVTAVPAEYFAENAEKIVAAVSSTLSLLAVEKRSALCRVGCEVITVLVQRLSAEPAFLHDVDRGTCSSSQETFSGALSQWTASLAKGTYVTVAAISTAADVALRAVAIQSHGHVCVVKRLLAVLSSGTQTELRRKCLGYLALCVAAAHAHRPESVRELIRLLAPVAVEYVSIGDSPSRKMARALCSVLRVLASDGSPTSRGVLKIADERVEHLVQQERPQVEPAVLGGPADLEELLFEADAFVSSTRSSFSGSTSRQGSGAMRGRGGGRGTVDSRRSSLSQHDGATEGVRVAPRLGQPPPASRSSGTSTGEASPPRRPSHAGSGALGELRSPTRRAAPTTGGGGVRRAKAAVGAGSEAAWDRRAQQQQPSPAVGGVYDTDSFLSNDASMGSSRPRAAEGSAAASSATHCPVPLSLRDGSGRGEEGRHASMAGVTASRPQPSSGAEAVGAARISHSLRRKIEENKSGAEGGGRHGMY